MKPILIFVLILTYSIISKAQQIDSTYLSEQQTYFYYYANQEIYSEGSENFCYRYETDSVSVYSLCLLNDVKSPDEEHNETNDAQISNQLCPFIRNFFAEIIGEKIKPTNMEIISANFDSSHFNTDSIISENEFITLDTMTKSVLIKYDYIDLNDVARTTYYYQLSSKDYLYMIMGTSRNIFSAALFTKLHPIINKFEKQCGYVLP